MGDYFTLPVILAFAASVIVIAALTLSAFSRRDRWIATVTPLASIIGSGFLISGPILAKEFGAAAAPAMMLLLGIAYSVGAVIRFNIAYEEPLLVHAAPGAAFRRIAQLSQVTLTIAYAISVAYYLKLLAAFATRAAGVESEFVSNVLVTAIIGALVLLSWTGSLRRIELVAHGSVSIKLGLIVGMLAALGAAWVLQSGQPLILPPVKVGGGSIALLLGLLITVQGFETSRYMGEMYGRQLRIETMKSAQLISTVIYLAFLILLTPFLGAAADTQGVAGILDVMKGIAPALAIIVLGAAVASQLSAAVADSIGATGLAVELSGKRLTIPVAFLAASALAIAVVWLTNPFSVVAVASRAFAAFYGVQCLLALIVARRIGKSIPVQAGIALMLVICFVAALTGAPAE